MQYLITAQIASAGSIKALRFAERTEQEGILKIPGPHFHPEMEDVSL